MAEILTSISTDHSLVLFCLSKEKSTIRGIGLWKFNSSLNKQQKHIAKIKKLIQFFQWKWVSFKRPFKMRAAEIGS